MTADDTTYTGRIVVMLDRAGMRSQRSRPYRGAVEVHYGRGDVHGVLVIGARSGRVLRSSITYVGRRTVTDRYLGAVASRAAVEGLLARLGVEA